MRVVHGLPISWNPVLATVYHGDVDFWRQAAWSPCSKFIAVAGGSTIEILDAASLDKLNTFDFDGYQYQKLGFSPDGHILTNFGYRTITSWDLQTGVPVSTIHSEMPIVSWRTSFSFTHSIDGKVLAVSTPSSQPKHNEGNNSTLINTYDLLSGTHISSYHAPEGCIVTPIWTHGKYLCFITVKPGSIILWEAAFTLAHTPAMIKSFPTPDEIVDVKKEIFLYLPTLSQLAFTARGTIFIWDAQGSRFLLKYDSYLWSRDQSMTFSPDGHFFVYSTNNKEVHVWKRSHTNYILHQKLSLHTPLEVLLSPNGESIIATSTYTMSLLHTKDQILPLPNDSVDNVRGRPMLRFSSNEVLAAFISDDRHMVKILDLQSGDFRLIIDVGVDMDCQNLAVTESTVAVSDGKKVITWDLPVQNCINAVASISDSTHTTTLDHLDGKVHSQCISPDLNHIATMDLVGGYSVSLKIHDMSTGRQLAGVEGLRRLFHVILGKHEVWCLHLDNKDERGWKIIEDGESGIMKLEALETITRPPQLLHWKSSCGYEVTHDGWVVCTTQKRLLWLPHNWRLAKLGQTWSGQFLGLWHSELPEVVILEFLE